MLKKALQVMKRLDYGQDVTLLSAIMEETIAEANGDAAATKRIEQGLLGILRDDKSSVNGKDFACRQLKIVATKDSVDTLAKMLADEKHAHMARYVLQAMPDAAAGKALLEALSGTSGKAKAGVIGSLGVRQESGAVAPLAALLSDSDAVVAQAAAQALGAIRSKEAGKALMAAKPSSAAVAHAADAAFACAESMLASGDKAGAMMMYKTLAKGTPAKHIKLAATRGMLACAGKK